MANLSVQLVSETTGVPVRGVKVAIRNFIGPLRVPVDYDNVTNEDGMADFLMIDPGLRELYVYGVLKAEIDVKPDSNIQSFGGTPVVVGI